MTCEDYLEDPEKNASHLESCDLCRTLAGDVDREVEVKPRALDLDALPLAGWEGASHRTWPLVAAGIVAVLSLAIVLFLAAGTSPVRGMTSAVTSGVTSFEAVSTFLGHGLRGAPPLVHVVVGLLFVTINAILVLLLRRGPRGIDV